MSIDLSRRLAIVGALALATCGGLGLVSPAQARPAAIAFSSAMPGDTVTVDVTAPDRAVVQVRYRRGVVEDFDPRPAPARIVRIVRNTVADATASASNLLSAMLNLNRPPDAGLFAYSPPALTPSASGNVPLERTFAMLRGEVSSEALPAMVQLSGTPSAYSNALDPNDEILCSAVGNYYPLPIPGAPMQTTQDAVERWIGLLNGSFPDAIWIGTQEPTHTLGYSTSFNANGCADVPQPAVRAADANNIRRFIAYWTPIARYLRANHMRSGGIQLNAGDDVFYASTASQIMAARMPLDFFTVQIYTPSARVDRALYAAYLAFRQNPDYRNVKVILDQYGLQLTGNRYGTASGMIAFLQDESQLLPYADMLYGYTVETKGVRGPLTLLPQVLTSLQSAPAPLRPVTSTTSDLQAFALVRKDAPARAYVALWNVSPSSTTHAASIVLRGIPSGLSLANLTVLKGSGSTIARSSLAGFAIHGDRIDGLTLGPGEFALVSIHA